jgi:hypothetical protein
VLTKWQAFSIAVGVMIIAMLGFWWQYRQLEQRSGDALLKLTGALVAQSTTMVPLPPQIKNKVKQSQAKPTASLTAETKPLRITSRGCALDNGQSLVLKVASVEVESKSGTQAVIGTLEAWRDEPRELLASGDFDVALSHYEVLEQKPKNSSLSLGVMALAGTSHKPALGPAIILPPLDIWRMRISVASGLAYAGNELQIMALVAGSWQ